MNDIYLTGDLHLNDPKILYFTRPDGTLCRPYATLQEHTEAVCDNWQDTVRPNDLVILNGDISYDIAGLDLIYKLNGSVIFIPGNNDKLGMYEYLRYFSDIRLDMAMLEYKFLITHRPIHERDFDERFAFNIHAHVHCNTIADSRYFNVSLDETDMRPIALETILERLNICSKTLLAA